MNIVGYIEVYNKYLLRIYFIIAVFLSGVV
jgi:hypothetical protein